MGVPPKSSKSLDHDLVLKPMVLGLGGTERISTLQRQLPGCQKMQRSTALASQLSGLSGWLLIRSSLYPLSGMYPYPQKYDEICFGRDMFPRTSGWESVSGIGEARHPIHSPHLRLGSVDASIVIGANHYTTFKNPSFQRFQPLRMKITKVPVGSS